MKSCDVSNNLFKRKKSFNCQHDQRFRPLTFFLHIDFGNNTTSGNLLLMLSKCTTHIDSFSLDTERIVQLSTMMHPVEEVRDWAPPAGKCAHHNSAEKLRRASWMPRSPFRPRNNNEDLVLSPESNCGSTCSPLRRASNSLRSPSLTPLSRALLREKLLGSRGAQRTFQQENEEGLDEVYENVETLLEVLRMERHQEKLRADEEIKQLKKKLTRYESKACCGEKEPDSSTANASTELADCLLETLALLEEECTEWQNVGKPRPSLDTITNQLSPSPQKKQQCKATTPNTLVKTPSQKLVRSIQRLRTVQSQLKAAGEESKALVTAFDKEMDADQTSEAEDTLLGLQLLEGSESSNSPLDSLDTSNEVTMTAESEFAQQFPSTEDLEDEVYMLRQQLWDQMMDHGNRVRELQDDIKAASSDKERLAVTLLSAQLETKRITSQMLEIFHQKQALQEQLQRFQDDNSSCTKELELTKLQHHIRTLQEKCRSEVEAKDHELSRAKKDTMIMQTRMMWVVHAARSEYGTRSSKERELSKQLDALKVQLLDTERKYLDAQMHSGIEQNTRLSMSIKLETAMTRLDDKDATILTLQQQLKDSKMMTRAYSSQVEYLSDELQRAQIEARESLEDKNQSMRKYRMDALLLRDDLNNSFSVMP